MIAAALGLLHVLVLVRLVLAGRRATPPRHQQQHQRRRPAPLHASAPARQTGAPQACPRVAGPALFKQDENRR